VDGGCGGIGLCVHGGSGRATVTRLKPTGPVVCGARPPEGRPRPRRTWRPMGWGVEGPGGVRLLAAFINGLLDFS
jgi:hypothetical protein